MGDVTGPISTLSGASHDVPDGMMCDEHPDRPAVARIQGETDSFGCEMIDMCQECLDADRAWRNSPEADEWRKGVCEWCKNPADDLRDARDYEEGMCGRVYRVCGACKKKDNDYWAAEAAAFDDDRYDDYDDYDDGDCWQCGGEGRVNYCVDGCCADQDDIYCDICSKPCDVCKPKKSSTASPVLRQVLGEALAAVDPASAPCGECHLKAGETCDVCGRRAPAVIATEGEDGAT